MRFSVITVCLNPGRYLEETIGSVLAQSCGDFEYWLIDGGSTDGTLEILVRHAAEDSRIRWCCDPEVGIAAAMNRGLDFASGDVVAFLHADDRYSGPQILAAVERGFRAAPQALWLTGGLREINESSAVLRELPVRSFSYRRLLRNNIIYHPATFVRREAFTRIGRFDSGLRYAMDYDLWLRLGKFADPATLAEPLAEFRVHEGSLSSRERKAALDEEYDVRCRYVQGRLGRLGHFLYHVWRRHRLKDKYLCL